MAYKPFTLQTFSRTLPNVEWEIDEWNATPLVNRRKYLAVVNAQGRAAYKAAQKAAKQQSRGASPRSLRSGGGANEDAYTRQGRISANDWNQMFHAP